MSVEAVIEGQKRRGARPALFVMLSVVVLATVFYLAGGMSLVARLTSDRVPEPPKKSSSSQPAAPAAAVPTDTPEPPPAAEPQGGLPAGIEAAFADTVFREQLDSRVNIEKLVTGRVGKLVVTGVTTSGDTADVAVTVTFVDGTSAPGVIGLAKKGEDWFFVSMTGGREGSTGGDADSISSGGSEPGGSSVPVDVAVRDVIMSEMVANQEYLAGIVDGTFDTVTIGKPSKGADSVSIPVSYTGPSALPVEGRVIAVAKEIKDRRYWFVTSFKE